MDKAEREEYAKKQKSISRDHWMCRVQRYCFGSSVPDFCGYCPFFWFTVLSIIVCPFIFLWHVFCWSMGAVANFLSRIAGGTMAVISPPRKKIPWHECPSADTLLEWNHYFEIGVDLEGARLYKKWMDFVGLENVERLLEEAREQVRQAEAYREELEKERDAALKRKLERRERMAALANKLALHAPRILRGIILTAKIVLGTLAAAVSVFLVYKLVTTATWAGTVSFFLFAFKWGGLILVAGVAFMLVLMGFIALRDFIVKLWQASEPEDKVRKKPEWLVSFGNLVNTAWDFCGEFVRVIYAQECPLLTIGDETTPIEKRDKSSERETHG